MLQPIHTGIIVNPCYQKGPLICLLTLSRMGIISAVSLYGGRLNKKDGLTRYGDSHVKDKTS